MKIEDVYRKQEASTRLYRQIPQKENIWRNTISNSIQETAWTTRMGKKGTK